MFFWSLGSKLPVCYIQPLPHKKARSRKRTNSINNINTYKHYKQHIVQCQNLLAPSSCLKKGWQDNVYVQAINMINGAIL